MFAAAATRGDILIKNVIPKHLEAITAKIRRNRMKWKNLTMQSA